MSDPLHWLADAAAARETAGLRRVLRARTPDGDALLDLAGNDYLGLSHHPEVVEGAAAAARTWGAGSTGSRLVTGTTALHAELERALASFVGAPAALVTSSGYLANLAVVTALVGDGDVVVSDARVHASLVDACRLSRAEVVVVAHADPAAVDEVLAARPGRRALVLTESLFSADGDAAPLLALHEVVRARGAVLVVDEAHGLGVLGPGGCGGCAAAGLVDEPDVVITATLSKALGSQGGVILARADVIAHLVDTARSVVFDTALAPPSAGAALAALRLLKRTPALAEAVLARAAALAAVARAAGFQVADPAGAVVSVHIGEPQAAVRAGELMREHGVRAGVFRPPSVPEGTARLRLTARADLTDADVAAAGSALQAVAAAGLHT